jgi:hypothetical protein
MHPGLDRDRGPGPGSTPSHADERILDLGRAPEVPAAVNTPGPPHGTRAATFSPSAKSAVALN